MESEDMHDANLCDRELENMRIDTVTGSVLDKQAPTSVACERPFDQILVSNTASVSGFCTGRTNPSKVVSILHVQNPSRQRRSQTCARTVPKEYNRDSFCEGRKEEYVLCKAFEMLI